MMALKVIEERGPSATGEEGGLCECGCSCSAEAPRQDSSTTRQKIRPVRALGDNHLRLAGKLGGLCECGCGCGIARE